jgi:autotransporter strand-loop-strand O-heptosyltransferase
MLSKGMWARSGVKYFRNWLLRVYDGDNLIFEHKFNPEGKRVYIAFDSSSLGDTFAWIPYVDEFRKKWNCQVIVSTFMNDLFSQQYPDVIFVKPGEVVHNLYAMFKIGWYYENNNWKTSTNPKDFKQLPLQQTITDILGLEFKEIKAKLKVPNVTKQKKVGIGLHSTCQAKYWNNPDGWQKVVDYLKELGWEVMLYSKEGDNYMGNHHPKGITKFKGGSVQDVINDLATCQFFIGLGSGLTWVAWSTGLPVVLISGFSFAISETTLDTYRVINENVCNGCFNRHRLDPSDWNWCPDHKGTPRQFECTKTITGEMVISKIDELIERLLV